MDSATEEIVNEYRDLLERAGWTFVQTALSLVLVGPMLNLDAEVWKMAALAGGASALSVVKTFAMQKAQK